MTTKRCNAAERKAINRMQTDRRVSRLVRFTEPALGPLEERLDIIIRRQGGTTGAVRMTDRERREYAYWLEGNGLVNGFLSVLDKSGAA